MTAPFIPPTGETVATVRHLAATLAYRAAKVLRETPPDFATTRLAASSRTPVEVVAHLADLMAWAVTVARGEAAWHRAGGSEWNVEVGRFFETLAVLDGELAAGTVPPGAIETMIQGPLADALTHVGQLAMLRGLAGLPVRPESYAGAPITAGRVGLNQGPPGREFDGDASARRDQR